MGSLLATVVAQVAVAILKTLLARRDCQESVLKEVANDLLALSVTANERKARASRSPGGGAELPVCDGAEPLRLPGQDPGPPGSAH